MLACGSDAALGLQGSESGGHGAGPTSTLCFVPEVMDVLQHAGMRDTPVLAAGGIATGRQVSALAQLHVAREVLAVVMN